MQFQHINQQTEFEEVLDQSPYVPLLNDLRSLPYNVDESYRVRFCQQKWIAIINQNILTLYQEHMPNLYYSMECDLQQLFKQEFQGDIEVQFMSTEVNGAITNYMLLIALNKILKYQIVYLGLTFQILLVDQIGLEFQKAYIYEDDQHLYVLTDYLKLITFYKNAQPHHISELVIKQSNSYFNTVFKSKPQKVFNKDQLVSFVVVEDCLMVASNTGNYALQLVLYQITPNGIIRDMSGVSLNLQSPVDQIISTVKVGVVGGIPSIFVVLYEESLSIQASKVILGSYEISRQGFNITQDTTIQFEDIKTTHGVNQRVPMKSSIEIINDKLHLLVSLNTQNSYLRNNYGESQFSGEVLGFGCHDNNNNQTQLKVAMKNGISTLFTTVNEVEATRYLYYQYIRIQRIEFRGLNQTIYNVFIDSFNKYLDRQKLELNLNFKLEGYSDNEVGGVINKITFELMGQSIAQCVELKEYLQSNIDVLQKWSTFVSSQFTNRSYMICILECIVFLKLGQFIQQHQDEMLPQIQECLDSWNYDPTKIYQFYQKLENVQDFMAILSRSCEDNNLVVELFEYCYKCLKEMKELNENAYIGGQYFTSESQFITIMDNVFKTSQSMRLQALYEEFILDFAQHYHTDPAKYHGSLGRIRQIIQEVQPKVGIDFIISQLRLNKLYALLYFLYLDSRQGLEIILQIIQESPQLCQDFVNKCIEQEQGGKPVLSELFQIVCQLNSAQCIIDCLTYFPKLQFFLRVMARRVEQFPHSLAMIESRPIVRNSNDCSQEFMFLIDCAAKIAKQ